MIEPREWQTVALKKLSTSDDQLAFLLEATPGSGKTIFSGIFAKLMFDRGLIDFVVVVVPTTALKGDADAGFLGDWNKVGIQITTVLKDGKGRASEWRGAVVTYQQLPNLVSTFETWVRNGDRVMFVFDEIHHAAEDNRWGAAAESVGRIAIKILCMTGTPFRGDGRRISFVRYKDDGTAIPDYTYNYRKAVSDKVCRQVLFMTDDGIADFILNETEHEVLISKATYEDLSPAAATLFKRDSEWLKKVIEKADTRLDDYRLSDIDAGGLVICRPGVDEFDDKHLRGVAALVKEVTGCDPVVITHDDQDANAKIERFRKDSTKWICAVRKISEGVDIKRLRVEVLANRPSTELLFRQLVGRVVRVDDPKKPGDATIFMAKFPQLVEWASQIADEAMAGLRDAQEEERDDIANKAPSDFVPLGSTHEDGGAISDFGETFGPDEITAAELLKSGDAQLLDIPVAKIAHLMRKAGVIPDVESTAGQPLLLQKKQIRESINKLARRAAIQKNPDTPDYQGVWMLVRRNIGAKNLDDLMDNHNIDVMRQAEAFIKRMLGGKDAANAA